MTDMGNNANKEDFAMENQNNEPLLSVRNLQISFASEAGTVHAVRNMNFDLYRGKTIGIVGESGSGKSVTSLAVMGLLDKNASVKGSVVYKGEELLTKSDAEMSKIRGKNIAMVFQDPLSALTPVFSIGDQLKEALVIHNPNMTEDQIRDRSIELLNLVGITKPAERLKAFPHEFSGGMRQRVMIAMAIANNPDIIIADEPTTALDVTIQAQVLDVLKKAQKETGAAMIFITHDLGVIAGVADEVIVMYAGHLVEHNSVEEIFAHPTQPYTIGLLGAVPRVDQKRTRRLTPISKPTMDMLIAEEKSGDTSDMMGLEAESETVRALLHAETEKTIKPMFEGIPREDRKVVLDVKGLVKTFPITGGGFLRRKVGEVRAVDGIDLEIREGETVALVGESGSGKSTTLMEIMSLKKPEAGSITVFGTELNDKLTNEQRRELRSKIQYVFQDPMSSLDPRMLVYDILAEPLHVQKKSKEEIRQRIAELMQLVELNPDQVDRFPTQFSGGQRQRIAIARALAVNPKLLLLDEPVSALDVSIQAGIINLLEDLQDKLGVAYLFVAHNMAVVRHISSRIAVMYHGRIVESGETDEVFDNPKHPYTKALISAVPIPDPVIEKNRKRIILNEEDSFDDVASV
ncbi:ABC transporter ATP-binding protein [Gardnerella pickettii]|uniref:Putative phosphonate C-P lyase system protein PhnK n=1 Tax=Gardnerella pickettii JCP8017A TaxID=1261062 RepID=T2PKE6_9BIFI|nr:ABC transporter ATP-binding protein [Gardnerella pickettii]MDK6472348.1 ABC transporter ATP-binding protein [Bifidobacterium sp. UMB9259]MDK7785070.1 ABC transporter ATP-binding protein [Bifidobacterium sp. UMB6791B]MDK8248558.1 ABC transporter ATP-binding protein [Bifidobacterium sp. UMB6794B]MDK8635547.1 ABC transporter ATP-binding protein [Bifidobacterium sp. UMB6791A]EIK82574.1 oligopeptide/dipeptide ABC transporter, ATPase subunit [Gardnerella pickettii 00703Bmash]